jgi:lysophospholipase L1-like esterase
MNDPVPYTAVKTTGVSAVSALGSDGSGGVALLSAAQMLAVITPALLLAPTTEPVAPNILWWSPTGLLPSEGIPPVVTDQPDDVSVTEGGTATFTVAASNATSYQWEKQEGGVGSWSAISGATSASYTTGTLTVASDNTDKFRCVIVGPGGTVTSNAATLTVTVAGPPSPQSIWLRANDESYSNGANVSQWSDRSGNSRHFTVGSNFPSFATAANNGKSAITFNGTNQGLSRSYTGSGTAYTLGCIVSRDSDLFRVIWQNGIAPYFGVAVGNLPNMFRGSEVKPATTAITFANWMPLIYRVSGTTGEIFLGSTRIASGSITAGPLAVAGLGNLASFFWNGKMQEVIAYESALSDANLATLVTYLLDQAGKADTPRQVTCEGDSLTAGVAPATAYPTLLQTALGSSHNVRNVATAGNTIVSVAGSNGNISSQTTTVDPWLTQTRLDAKKQVAVIWCGTNDLFYGRTGAQAHADFKTYCQARQTAGGRVIAVNMIDRTTTGGSWSVAQQSAFNALFASEAATYSDAQYNAAAVFTDKTNTTYYNGDQTHLTTTANQLIADAIAALILAG